MTFFVVVIILLLQVYHQSFDATKTWVLRNMFYSINVSVLLLTSLTIYILRNLGK